MNLILIIKKTILKIRTFWKRIVKEKYFFEGTKY